MFLYHRKKPSLMAGYISPLICEQSVTVGSGEIHACPRNQEDMRREGSAENSTRVACPPYFARARESNKSFPTMYQCLFSFNHQHGHFAFFYLTSLNEISALFAEIKDGKRLFR